MVAKFTGAPLDPVSVMAETVVRLMAVGNDKRKAGFTGTLYALSCEAWLLILQEESEKFTGCGSCEGDGAVSFLPQLKRS